MEGMLYRKAWICIEVLWKRGYTRMLVQNMPVHVVFSCARWSTTLGGFVAHDWAVICWGRWCRVWMLSLAVATNVRFKLRGICASYLRTFGRSSMFLDVLAVQQVSASFLCSHDRD